MNGDYFVAAVLAALAIVVPLWPTRCHHRWACIARALYRRGRRDEPHRRNTEAGRSGR